MFFCLTGLISLSIYSGYRKATLLIDCSNKTKALVIDNYRISKRGNTIKYTYSAEGKIFTTSESISRDEVENFKIGDSILILYGCKDHSISSYDVDGYKELKAID